MIILGIHPGYHDACAALFDDYTMVAAVAQERMTRRKSDGGSIPGEAIDECLEIAGLSRADVDVVAMGRGVLPWRYYSHFHGGRLIEGKVRTAIGRSKPKSMERELVRHGRTDSGNIFHADRFLADFGFRPDCSVTFFNHHLAHALPTLFHTGWENALLYTADGGGDNVQYSHRVFRDGKLDTLYGGDEELLRPMRIDSLGLAYGFVTQALGFRINRHEGKVTGLAALGEPVAYDDIARHFSVDGTGQVTSDFADNKAMRDFLHKVAEGVSREDLASSIQRVLEEFVIDSVRRLLDRHGVRHLGLSGGVFANVRLNQRLAEETPVDEIFVYPAMSDQGLAAGGVHQYLCERDGLTSWLGHGRRFETLYFGRDYTGVVDKHFAATADLERLPGAPAETAARLIGQDKAVAIYSHGMEYGPRALGARSIMASATDKNINDILNARLERSEFMPFAPVVAADDADTLFDIGRVTREASRFMTVTCNVRPEWRERIPAVVHVDGTARPQVIARGENPLYFDILRAYRDATGIPALVNTSFNAHEEPIIDTPAQCARALLDDRVDYVVTDTAVYGCRKPGT